MIFLFPIIMRSNVIVPSGKTAYLSHNPICYHEGKYYRPEFKNNKWLVNNTVDVTAAINDWCNENKYSTDPTQWDDSEELHFKLAFE